MSDSLAIAAPADFHVHLRQGEFAAFLAPHVRKGGFRLAYVMPNLRPPISNTEEALLYRAQLQAADPTIDYLMTLYLSPELTPDEIRKAKRAGVVGVKSYPRGVTTNSDGGIESYEAYYPVFEAMEQEDMVLNLHGEVPSDASTNICHATTRAAVECVKGLGDTVACTVTAHHLALTVDDWAGQSWHFCKPVAKYPDDRQALQDVIKEGHPRFFLGSDSAPHPPHTKSTASPLHACAAGVYTSAILLPLVAHLLDSFGALGRLEGFVSTYGRAFYRVPVSQSEGKVVIRRVFGRLVEEQLVQGEQSVVPFWAGKPIGWEIVES
ncbi:Dihydroorotase [Fomitopsis serialis]|uniref:Dihydroorotase n=1 Tax=Fomitopsis serialis TaxID=139415 RepID=UPI00200795D1|nr:Dihydroorotase [Neoantrodia serialis]KAH9938615.1 Dihydroorotase [Neoantrodia serialis]